MSKGYMQVEFQFPNAKNGSFYVYVAGGTFTNYADVYDPLSGEVLSQPLTIDSNGYVQGFHIDSLINYDILVKDYSGTVRYTRQNASVIGGGSSTPGPQGPKGDKGDTGATGPQGPAGINGTNGVDGTNGTDGVNGQDGDGLYSIYISNEETGEISYTKTSDPTAAYIAGNLFPTGVGQVKVSVNDNLGYLQDKFTAGNGIAISASNFDVIIENTSPETYKVKANAIGVEDYLGSVLQAGTGINLQLTPDLSKIQIIATGDATGGWVWQGLWSSATTYNANDAVNYYDASGIPVINRVYVATSATSANPYTDGTGWFLAFSIDTAGDQFVKLDSDDTLNSYLLDKIKPGDGISFARTDTSAGSYVTVNASISALNVSAAGTSYNMNDLSNTIEFTSGTRITPAWDGTKLKFNHGTAGTSAVSAYKPTFDSLGHYTGDLGPLTVNEIVGLTSALSVAGDGKVMVTSSDTKGYLEDKILGSDNIDVITSGNKLVISATGEFDTYKSKVSSSGSADYLGNKIIGSNGITVTSAGDVITISQNSLTSGAGCIIDSEPAIGVFTSGTTGYLGTIGPAIIGSEFVFGDTISGFPAGLLQFNYSAPIFNSITSTTPPISAFRGYSPNAYYSNGSEQAPLIYADFGSNFGGTTNSRYTFSAAGKWQINWGAQMFTPAGSHGDVNAILRHYSSTGTLKNKFDAREATGFWTTSGISHPIDYGAARRSEVLNIASGDYIELRLAISGQAYGSTGGATSAYQIDYSGHLIENTATTFNSSNGLIVVEHYRAGDSTERVGFYYDSNDNYDTVTISRIFNHNVGDYYKIYYNLSQNVYLSVGTISVASLVGAKGDKGDPGESSIAAIHGYGNIVATSGTSGVDITTTPNLSATYLTLNGNLTSGVPLGTIEYDSITDRFWITTNT